MFSSPPSLLEILKLWAFDVSASRALVRVARSEDSPMARTKWLVTFHSLRGVDLTCPIIPPRQLVRTRISLRT